MPRRGRRRRRRPWSDEIVILIILRELFERKRREESASTAHHLATLRVLPTQRDVRVRRLVENLAARGHVTKVQIGERFGYEISEAGIRWWINHPDLLDFFLSLKD